LHEEPLVVVENLKKFYSVRRGFISAIRGSSKIFIRAVDGVSFQIEQGEALGLVGETGSGKTTTGRLLVLLESPTEGMIKFKGINVLRLKKPDLKKFRRKVQMIFQDPYDSLDPRYTVFDTICEVLKIHNIGLSGEERTEMVLRVLEDVGLKPPDEFVYRLPHELSGGQRQRVAIARAIVLNPEFIVADEPVSMLDASVRTGIINLMLELKKKRNVTYLFISHDLAVTRYMCDKLAIMYMGKIVEFGPTELVIANMFHPYTKALISSVPIPDPKSVRERALIGEMLTIKDIPNGCRFHPRCPNSKDLCKIKEPELKELNEGYFVACHFI
jgi:peptide/nickel transport system ATP-binding protein